MGRKSRNQSQQSRKSQTAPAEPYWAPLERPVFSIAQIALIAARHLVPLLSLWVFGGSTLQFLLLCVFNLAFTIAAIGTVGVAVSTRMEVGEPHGVADRVGAWITLAVVCVGASLMLSFLFGWVLAAVASEEAGYEVWNRSLWWSLLAIVASAVPGMLMQYRDDLRLRLSDQARKQRDQPVVGVHLFSMMAILLLSGWMLGWGRFGAILMALMITALFIFRDLRPDLARELTRTSNRAK